MFRVLGIYNFVVDAKEKKIGATPAAFLPGIPQLSAKRSLYSSANSSRIREKKRNRSELNFSMIKVKVIMYIEVAQGHSALFFQDLFHL